MGYTNALWIKTTNSYSKWPPFTCIQFLSLCGHSSSELCNTSTEKFEAAFQRDLFKLSILGGLFLQHPLPWMVLELPAGLSPSTQGTETQQWLETNVPDFITTSDWPSASPDLNLLDCKLWSSLQETAYKKRQPNIESLKLSLQKAAADFPVDVLRNWWVATKIKWLCAY